MCAGGGGRGRTARRLGLSIRPPVSSRRHQSSQVKSSQPAVHQHTTYMALLSCRADACACACGEDADADADARMSPVVWDRRRSLEPSTPPRGRLLLPVPVPVPVPLPLPLPRRPSAPLVAGCATPASSSSSYAARLRLWLRDLRPLVMPLRVVVCVNIASAGAAAGGVKAGERDGNLSRGKTCRQAR